MHIKGIQKNHNDFITAARGLKNCDLVIQNVSFLDVFSGHFIKGDVAILDGIIIGTQQSYTGQTMIDGTGLFLVPGFIDSHVHIESSLLVPKQFERMALPKGTTTAIWDPHEIANVFGKKGISWALDEASDLTMDVFVMLPSCVPATSPQAGLETAGAILTADDLREFVGHPKVLGLAEMMNIPGVLMGDEDIIEKLKLFSNKDGHAPGLSGYDLNAYTLCGLSTCHESISLEEAQEKLSKGLHVLIRDGSCAKNAKDLLPLLNPYSSATIGLCSDDRNPLDTFQEGHIDFIIREGLKLGYPPESLFRTASWAPATLYGLKDRGAIAPGYIADLCLVESLQNWKNGFTLRTVFKNGCPVTKQETIIPKNSKPSRNLHINSTAPSDFVISSTHDRITKVHTIGVIPNQIVTEKLTFDVSVIQGNIQASYPLNKIVVMERHHGSQRKSIGLVKGFSLKKGAIATSINHDCHHIIAVGASDEALSSAINRLIQIDGGIVVFDKEHFYELELPIGGLMSEKSPEEVFESLKTLNSHAQKIGCTLESPFIQLSFLALPVIPHLKITDRGLVDVQKFELIKLEVE